MKLRNLKSVGHNAAHSYLSTLGHIGGMYASTYLHRMALRSGLSTIELDILGTSIPALVPDAKVADSLQELRAQFMQLLQREGIPTVAVKTYRLFIELVGDRIDVVDIRCKPVLIDSNNKEHICAVISVKYPDPI